MTTREVVLDGGSPWGFRMHGGVDVQQPLRISRVNPGSKAAIRGVREGDIITSINSQPTRDITNSDAHILLKKSGDTLKLGLNEDCRGSPKRRQYKTVQQESHSESIERSSSSKSSYHTSSTSVTINRSQSDAADTENPILAKTNGQLEKNGDPENGVISQRSTLSSTCSLSPNSTEPRGIGIEIRQAPRDTAARNNDTKPVSADNEKDVIADTEMGGNSRSHKKRSRASRKKIKNTVSTDGETMVELPCEVTSPAENKVLERVQTNYRVESPETVSKKTNANKKPNGGTVIKSKSLDDDDLLKITELSEVSEGEDNKSAECSAVVSEAESDVEWEKTEELKPEETSVGECLSTMSLPLEELETVHVTLISPEDEKNLRNFLQGLNLTTAPEEESPCASTSKKENYKERKARKRAAIAEHFMPVLQFPRFLDVIREEGDNNENIPYYSTDKYHFIKSQEFVRSKDEQSIQKKMETHFPKSESEKVVVVGGKLTEAANVQGTWSTSIAETSNSDPDVVYLSSTSETSEDADEEDDGKIEKILPPPSQLTPPPTPDLSTPKNETDTKKTVFQEEDVFNKEFKGFCDELNVHDPCKYVNAVSPPRSPSVSSEGSSKTNSQCTARYNPMCSSIADVADLLENGVKDVETLRELCLKELMSLPFGTEVLEELAEVSQSIQDLTIASKLRKPIIPAFMSKKPISDDTNSSFNLPATKEDLKPKLDEARNINELHEKFINRRDEMDHNSSKTGEFSNRLLAIIRETSAPQHREGNDAPKETSNLEKLKRFEMQEWLREKSASVPNLEMSNRIHQNKNESTRVPSSPRRFSLPQEVHQRQIHYIQEKEKELQAEIEKLEKEKRRVISEMADEEKFPKSEEAPTEIFRQKMYDEYMRKVAAREERKLHKVIKITSSRTTEELTENMCEVTHASGIEDEFMDKVKERMRKYGLKRDSEEPHPPASEDLGDPILVMDGDSLKAAKELPKHLQEFIDMTRRAADTSASEEENMSDGVWSPGQKPTEFKSKENINDSQEHKKRNEPPAPPVWTPRSAGSSPTAERKEFRPVNFESPVLGRKNKPKTEGPAVTPASPSVHPPWQAPDGSSDVGVALSSSLERRIPTSHSAPASGFTEFSTPRLPRAQNPTITLLQKAREGQLPRGASYIQADPTYSYRSYDDRPPTLGPGEVLYQIKNEYTSESDSERPRKMADLGPRKYEIGIGPTTIDGMPLVLRSEVRDGNQSRWYKRMYDTIHKQKPPRDYVTVRYKQRRARYPYASGYFSEPEHSAFSADYYDSDGTVSDSKYATLDRRRIQPGVDKENDYMSAIPTDRDATNGDVIRHGQDVYKNQPGRIENYLPGRSSISEKEAKEWWDEVMDIFDGHLEQQKNVPQPRSYMSQALKESGYESDSTLVFRRREDAIQQLSPSEQREAYKTIQKGGDVPLHGLRKLAPERPKEDAEIEYFPISPNLTRIRIHKNNKPQNQVHCYPLSVPPHPRHVFAEYKRSAPSASASIPKPPPIPPSPPKRRSSRNSNTLRLISTMKVRGEKSPSSRRHETCFTSTSNVERNKVKYLKDKITCKLSPTPKRKPETRLKVTKTVSVSPSLRSSVSSTLSASKASPNKISSRTDVNISRSLSASPVRKPCKTCTTLNTPKKVIGDKPKPGTFGSEKRKDLTLPKTIKIVKSTELLSPTEVKKAVISQINSLPIYKKSQALYSSVKNGASPKEKTLPIQVGFSPRGRELLRPSRVSNSLPATPILARTLRTRNTTPSPCPSEKSSQKSQSASLDSLKSLRTLKRDVPATASLRPKPKPVKESADNKLKKSKKDQLNGEIAKRVKKTKIKPTEKCAGKAAGSEIVRQLRNMEEEEGENLYALTQDAIQKQREAIQTDSFFQHLFWRDIPSPPPSITSQGSWIAEKTRMLQRHASSFSEPSIGALKIYLNHTKPVTDSKFRSLDAALVRSRSASPKSVTWKIEHPRDDKFRSISLPPKLIFTRRSASPILMRKRYDSERSTPSKIILTQTSRPVSPVVTRNKYPSGEERLSTRPVSPGRRRVEKKMERSSSPSKLIFTETSRPVSPIVRRRRVEPKMERSSSPTKLIFTETSRPVSPIISRRRIEPKMERSSSPSKLIFTETTRPISPVVTRKYVDRSHDCGIRKSASTSKLIFSQTSRPVSPIIERKKRSSKRDLEYLQQCLEAERERTTSPSRNLRSSSPLMTRHAPTAKLIFTETSRPVSPVVERRYTSQKSLTETERSYSPSAKLYFTETTRPVSPLLERRYLHERDRSSSPSSKLYFSETSRPVSPIVEKRFPKKPSEEERSFSPSSKLFFSETSRPVSPIVEKRFIKKPEQERSYSPNTKRFVKKPEEERSFSPSSKLYFSETIRPVSPVVEKRLLRTPSPTTFRSPSSRKITQSKNSRDDIKRRSRSADDAEELTFDDGTELNEIIHSPKRCSRFKELNKFYSTLERMGELERTTSSSELRPRRKNEEEIIDFDRWKEVHTRERAEKELETLYVKLKGDQKEKGFLFRPKDVETYRWRKDLDRGLRIKDKSVENIKDSFEKLKEGSDWVIPDELVFRRDLYKPLWRGNSVADLASSMVERRSQSEGRVTAIRKKLLESERLLTHGIGSRIWSSLSSEQINLLKGQLAEIYNQNGQRKYQTDYSVEVESPKTYRPKLSVRRNSDELVRRRYISEPSRSSSGMSTSLILSETDKKRLSQSLSREVMDRVSQRQKNRTSLSLVLGKETRGAIAAAEAKMKSEGGSPRTCYSLEMSEDEKDKKRDSDFVLVLTKDDTDAHKNNINATMQEWAQPKKALVSTDVTHRGVTSMSETESGSTDESTKTVVYLGNKDVQKKVEYFELVAEEQPYTPTIYRAADGNNNDTQLEFEHSEEVRQPRKLVPSQSYQDFKELFGEQEGNKLTAAALAAARPPPPNSVSSNGSTSVNLSPQRLGEVQHLKNKFELVYRTHPRRSRSNPELEMKDQITIPGQSIGEVDTLRRKYEYPWIFNRGRSRIRRGGVVSPIYFRAGDRYMPHINIISKIASLYPKKTVFLSDVRQKSAEELARILGCPLGEVERLRQRFDSPESNISLLGHMFTSSPNIHELRDIAPYLTGPWAAHKYPKVEDNTRSLSSPESIPHSRDTSSLKKDRPRPKSVSPPRLKAKLSPILKSRKITQNGAVKHFDPKMHQPLRRYQPPCPSVEPVRIRGSDTTSQRTPWIRLFRNRVAPEICGKRGDDSLQESHKTGGEGIPQRRRADPQTSGAHETRL